MTDDVEKRWNDRTAYRAAVFYDLAVIAAAFGWLIIYLVADPASSVWAIGVPAILLLGGLGAFVQTYRVWKRGGGWPVWQGAGWFLFVLMLLTLSLPVTAD
ncbi:hypothetical protein [Williamsia muralis]|uniref:Uncharacterized protein n=1 Tax=Williamsia marianensis TaxID=85044 RepID=A0A2G3PL75_WILMA|nr:hypothetical protein [Williamsia marianensis]PHV66575.1 hypothetical protein CSW57_09685 [Williamsia marianensis]PZU03782.1 MAG: hypothetical protein DI630_03125 [Gordonia sp. (in: high G+C Gram-positive bacteria)]